jgi:hypothetical protein
MSEPPDERCGGVAGHDVDPQPAPETAPRGCRGCLADGHTENHRDEQGRLRPGHSANALGRPHGRLNDTTLLANERMRSLADRAVAVLAAGLDSPIDWVRIGAATKIIERTGLGPNANGTGDPPDTAWMEYLTDRELRYLERLIERAKARVPFRVVVDDSFDSDGRDPNPLLPAAIDVESRPIPPGAPGNPVAVEPVAPPVEEEPEEEFPTQ